MFIKNKFLNNFNYRSYFLRILFFHLSLIFLKFVDHDDLKIISLESFLYSINVYTYLIFSFIELLIRCINDFGLNTLFLINRFDLDNLGFIYFYLDTINYYFLAYAVCLLYIIVNKIKIKFNKKIIFILTLFFIIFGLLYKSSTVKFKIKTHNFVKNAIGKSIYYKLTNTIQSTKLEKSIYEEIRNLYLYFNNDKKNNYIEKINENDSKGLGYFQEKFNLKSKNNIYIIITESYAFFKDNKMNDKLIDIFNNDGNKIIIDQKGWNKTYSTQGAEFEIFCDANLKKLINFLEQVKNCNYEKNFSNFNKVFIHTYLSDFNGRYQYRDLFNKSIFLKELEAEGFKNDCPWNNGKGLCDHEVINKLMFYNEKNNQNLIFFLSLNTHPPLKPIKDAVYNCNKFLTTSRNMDLCHYYYNLEIFFKNLSRVYNEKKTENDILIIYSDTPPLFSSKKNKKYILYDKVPILIIE